MALDDNSTIFRPAVDRGLVVVGVKTFVSPTVGEVVALDAATGAIRWRTPMLPELPNYQSGSLGGVLFYQDLVIVPNEDGRVQALDRNSGVVRWNSQAVPDMRGHYVEGIPAPSEDHRSLALVGTTVIATSLYNAVEGLDAATGRTLWRTTPDLGGTVAPVATGTNFAVIQFLGGQLACVRSTDGAVLWKYTGFQPYGEFPAAPTVQGDTVFAPGRSALWALRVR